MSIDQDVSPDKMLNSPNTKLNKLQNFIGNSIFGKLQKSNEQLFDESSGQSIMQSIQEDESKKFYLSSTDMENKKEVNKGSELTGESTEVAALNDIYMPELSMNHYVNRHEKIIDIQRFLIKDSKTKFILI